MKLPDYQTLGNRRAACTQAETPCSKPESSVGRKRELDCIWLQHGASLAFEKVFFEPPIMPVNRLSPHLRWLSRFKPVEIVPEGRTYSRLSSGFGR
jgi:hypothetical protein